MGVTNHLLTGMILQELTMGICHLQGIPDPRRCKVPRCFSIKCSSMGSWKHQQRDEVLPSSMDDIWGVFHKPKKNIQYNVAGACSSPPPKLRPFAKVIQVRENGHSVGNGWSSRQLICLSRSAQPR